MSDVPKKVQVIHGPNLNLLGARDPSMYGTETLDEINQELELRATKGGATLKALQSNLEGEIVSAVQKAGRDSDVLIINPGGYSHTSVAIRDAIDAISIPCIEVHLSNIHGREEFRRRSITAEPASGLISGFGALSYYLALDAALALVEPSGDESGKGRQ